MRAQRADAIAAATEPINRRYSASLEKLLTRATNLETALAIKAALASVPQTAAKQLVGRWALAASTGYGAEVVFRADGTGTHSGYGKFQWRIDGKLRGVNYLGNELTLTRK